MSKRSQHIQKNTRNLHCLNIKSQFVVLKWHLWFFSILMCNVSETRIFILRGTETRNYINNVAFTRTICILVSELIVIS